MTITETDLAKARTAWGDGLIAISTAFDAGGIDAAKAIAGGLLDSPQPRPSMSGLHLDRGSVGHVRCGYGRTFDCARLT